MNEQCYRYVYGPVPSRRLGLSLGIDIVPFKTCTYDCIYCQLGRTTNKTVKREDYIVVEDVLAELDRKLACGIVPDYISLAGSGEPTLNLRIGDLIGKIRKMTSVPVAVLTNGSLLWMQEVRESLMEADLVLPSLDAGDASLFHHVNRPQENLSFERIIWGMIDFSGQFPGAIWIEVFLLDGVTGIQSEVEKISALTRQIRHEKVHLNTVSRPPAEKFAFAVPQAHMNYYASLVWGGAEVIADIDPGELSTPQHPEIPDADLLALLSRRPCTVHDVSIGLSANPIQVSKQLQELNRKSLVKIVRRDAAVYFETARSR